MISTVIMSTRNRCCSANWTMRWIIGLEFLGD
jgi:hypothetical protein